MDLCIYLLILPFFVETLMRVWPVHLVGGVLLLVLVVWRLGVPWEVVGAVVVLWVVSPVQVLVAIVGGLW